MSYTGELDLLGSPIESDSATVAQAAVERGVGEHTAPNRTGNQPITDGDTPVVVKVPGGSLTHMSVPLDLQNVKDNAAAQTVAEVVARTATLGSRWKWLNWTWGILVTMSLPGIGAVIWWGLIPVGDPEGSFSDKAVFALLVNPMSAAVLSYLLCSMFLTGLDPETPWRPIKTFLPTVSAVFVTQIIFPGLVVLLDHPFRAMAVPALLSTFVVTIIGIHQTPEAWLGCTCTEERDQLAVVKKVFTRICIVFVIFSWTLALFTYASAVVDGAVEAVLALLLSVTSFIFKKILLAYTDQIGIDSAMLVSGFWVENLSDMFITLAFPEAEEFGVTFGIIFATRIIENAAYIGFQMNAWFKFRIWIKGKFKKDQGKAIEDDLAEYEDDRGHSAHHPGYRRRQLRFLSLKIFSQITSYVFFMMVIPVLRYGPNKERFPYRNLGDGVEPGRIFTDTLLDPSRGFLSTDAFKAAMAFAFVQILAVLISGALIWWWMYVYCPDILHQVRVRYDLVAANRVQHALILGIMVSNALIATSFIQVYYRVFFL